MSAHPQKVGMFVDITGQLEVQRRLEKVRRAAIDLKPAFREIAAGLNDFAQQQFLTSGAAGGSVWKPLSKATLELRQHPRGGYKGWGRYYRHGTLTQSASTPLIFTTKLMQSFTHPGPKHVQEIHAESMRWGSKHPLAHLVVEGVAAGRRKTTLPARPVIHFASAEQQRRLTVEPIERQLRAAAEGAL